jgi:hypothetical protein
MIFEIIKREIYIARLNWTQTSCLDLNLFAYYCRQHLQRNRRHPFKCSSLTKMTSRFFFFFFFDFENERNISTYFSWKHKINSYIRLCIHKYVNNFCLYLWIDETILTFWRQNFFSALFSKFLSLELRKKKNVKLEKVFYRKKIDISSNVFMG